MKAGSRISIKNYQCKLAATKRQQKNHSADLPQNGHSVLADFPRC